MMSSAVSIALLLALVSWPATAAPAPPGWGWFRDGGVELAHPPDWRVERDEASGRIAAAGPRGERLIVWPLFVDGPFPDPTAARVLTRMATAQAPAVTWSPVRAVSPRGLRTDGRAGGEVSAASLTWTPSARGTAVQFALAAAPADRRRDAEEAFAAVLGSLRLTGRPGPEGGAGGSPAADVAFVRFQDPAEGAFALDVPRGWRVAGGLVRKAPVDVRTAVVASTPDDQVHLRLGDVDLPPFVLPTAMLRQLGFAEGASYSPGYGVTMQVLRYLPGEQFAGHYVTSRVGPTCTGLQIAGARPLPQTVDAMNAIMARHGSPVMTQRLHAGDVAFRCQRGATPMVGYLFTATMLTAAADGSGTWTVEQLQGYLAAADRASQAQAVLARMVQSVRLNPEWVRMQQNVTAAVSGIVADTGAHIAKVIGDGYWSRQASQAGSSRRRSNQILGLEDVRDPATGRELKVESGANYYWIDQRGNITGTDVFSRPTLDARELVRLP
jgi:hypothetical protein